MLIISKFTETTPKTKKIRFLKNNVAFIKKKCCTFFRFKVVAHNIKAEKAENYIVARI